MISIATAVLGCFLSAEPDLQTTPATGSVCVAPLPSSPTTASPDAPRCDGSLSVRIDDGSAVDWPLKNSATLQPLDLKPRHRVIVLCDKKPLASFLFRFSTFDEPNLCLFVNSFYSTLQLWEQKRARWCKCDTAAGRR
jgi:hypothetical protein